MNVNKTIKFKLNDKINNDLTHFFKGKPASKNLKLSINKYLKELESNGSIIIQNYPILRDYVKNFKKFSSLFGILHKQNRENEQIVRIENEGKKWTAKNRGYKTRDKLDLHTDGGKISLLLSIKNNSKGGENLKLNAETVYSKIKNNTLKKKLFEGFVYHTRHEAKNRASITRRKYPIFFFKKKILHCMYNSKPIIEAAKYTKNKDNLEIIKKLKKIINNLKDNYEIFKLKQGDIWIVNNFKVLHGRKGFKDAKEKRLMLRAWVSPKKFKFDGKTILDAYNDR